MSYYIEDTEIRQHVYFVGHALGLMVISYSWGGSRFWRDLFTGFFIGRFIDEIYYFVLGHEESNLSYSLLFLVVFVVFGFCWRRWKRQTQIAMAVSAISTFLKFIGVKVMYFLFPF